jgi:hypothetical protein
LIPEVLVGILTLAMKAWTCAPGTPCSIEAEMVVVSSPLTNKTEASPWLAVVPGKCTVAGGWELLQVTTTSTLASC